jgi:hypothetical protein
VLREGSPISRLSQGFGAVAIRCRTDRGNAADVISLFLMSTRNMLGWVALGIVIIVAIVVAVRYPRAGAAGARVDTWNSSAIQGTPAGIRVREVDPTHAAVVFFYDLDNRTDNDYRLASGPNVVIMSRLRSSGSLSGEQPISLDTTAFVPAKNRTRIAIEMSHPFEWPSQRDASAERQIRQLVADQVSGLAGFVLFDQANRYEIDLAATSPELQPEPTPSSQN